MTRIKLVEKRYQRAMAVKDGWLGLWQDCYNYALPQHKTNSINGKSSGRRGSDLYDATASDAIEQLAASLLGHLTPPWSQWFGLKPGPDVTETDRQALASILEKAAKTVQSHFDRSNFSVELHQCFLDLTVGGTASLLFEESEPGALSAFNFTSVPLMSVAMDEGGNGRLENTYRKLEMTAAQIRDRYPYADLPEQMESKNNEEIYNVCESVVAEEEGYVYSASVPDNAVELAHVRLEHNPFINFRWMKSPGEIYGRSPVMKVLPDIKTANKVVELILKNASIAISGIWQADDDGVLNPANIELIPGAIIPKAVGSKGLTPLDMPGRFDVSQLVLEDLRARIRHALLVDRLPQIEARSMTATEVLERSGEMSLLLGASYGRLQSELLTPLIIRAYEILRRRGEVPDIQIDGRMVEIDYRSPLARTQGQKHVQNTLSWINSVLAMGPEAAQTINLPQAATFLAEALGVPSDLVNAAPALPAESVNQGEGELYV